MHTITNPEAACPSPAAPVAESSSWEAAGAKGHAEVCSWHRKLWGLSPSMRAMVKRMRLKHTPSQELDGRTIKALERRGLAKAAPWGAWFLTSAGEVVAILLLDGEAA